MVCKSCGKTLRSGEKFCTVCGCYNDFDDEEVKENGEDNSGEEALKELARELTGEDEKSEREKRKEQKAKEKEMRKALAKEEKERRKAEKEAERAEREAEKAAKQTETVETVEEDDDEEVVEFVVDDNKKTKVTKEDVLDTLTKDERNVAIFIGEDYKWIAQRPFNVFAMLFSWIYFLYRKMYLIGIIGLVVVGVIVRLVPILTIPIIVISMIGSGFLFNKIYLKMVEKKVTQLEEQYSGQTNFERILKKKGGVNIPIALLIFFIFLAVVLLSYFNLSSVFKKNSKYANENSENISNCRSIAQQVYRNLDIYQIDGEIKEGICEVIPSVQKEYRLYFIVNRNSKEEYTMFETGSGLVTLKAYTVMIEKLETIKKQNKLVDSDEAFLQRSKELNDTYNKYLSEAKKEDELIKQNKDTGEKLHYVLTKDDIIG